MYLQNMYCRIVISLDFKQVQQKTKRDYSVLQKEDDAMTASFCCCFVSRPFSSLLISYYYMLRLPLSPSQPPFTGQSCSDGPLAHV
jgi:hypothetical protein